MRTSPYRILLVGKSLSANSGLCHFLESLGGRLTRSETLTDAASRLRLSRFHVVLSQMRLDEGTACSLLKNLVASTLILSFPVESTYLWVPAIWNGQECWGTTMLRPGEFRSKLRELLVRPRAMDSRLRRVRIASVLQNPTPSPANAVQRQGISHL